MPLSEVVNKRTADTESNSGTSDLCAEVIPPLAMESSNRSPRKYFTRTCRGTLSALFSLWNQTSQSYGAGKSFERKPQATSLHVDRVARGDCNHRHPRRVASARLGQSQGQSGTDLLPEQHEADRNGRDPLHFGFRPAISALSKLGEGLGE